MKFPKHKGSMTITHNEHTVNYLTVKEEFEDNKGYYDFISEKDKQICIDTNEMWTIHWYPDTPIGFYSITGSSFELVLEEANKD